jgi:hypothetical protein
MGHDALDLDVRLSPESGIHCGKASLYKIEHFFVACDGFSKQPN